MSDREVRLTLNGRDVAARVRPNQTLLEVLRDRLGATDVRYGCGEGVCGTCTVLLDGESVNACTVLAVQVDGHEITTLRGLAGNEEDLHPLQREFLGHDASQCGFCTAGMVLMAYELVRDRPGVGRDDVRRGLAGNICRCTGYSKIVDAVVAYATRAEAEDSGREERGR